MAILTRRTKFVSLAATPDPSGSGMATRPLLALLRHPPGEPGMSAFAGDSVAKLFSRLPTRNIDSRTSRSTQYRIRDAGFSDSIIARWQRPKEFCNTIAG